MESGSRDAGGRKRNGNQSASAGVGDPCVELLAVLHDLLLAVQTQLDAATAAAGNCCHAQPCGVGALTSQVLEREILDWHRFKNRRQVASLTGMCPGVRASGARSRQRPHHQARQPAHPHRLDRTGLALRRAFNPNIHPLKNGSRCCSIPKPRRREKESDRGGGAAAWPIDLWRINTAAQHGGKTGTQINQ